MSISKVRVFFAKLAIHLWPVRRHELRKFIPTSLLMFCILFNQNILRILKDSIVIPEISSEITSFIKAYCVTPVAALLVILYAYMVNNLNFEKIYRYLTLAFLSFFICFAFYFYPQASIFHPDLEKVNELMLNYPHFKWYIALAANWSYIIFYVLSELWPNIFYALLFWQFANEVTTTDEAKRFYMLFSLFGNSSLIVGGLIVIHFASSNSILQKYFSGISNNVLLVQSSITIMAVSSICSIFLVRFIYFNAVVNAQLHHKMQYEIEERPKMNLRESFEYIISSKYLWFILICTASFGFSINLVEGIWKAQIKDLYSTTNAYAEFNGYCVVWTGVLIILLTLVGNAILRYYSWFAVAIITPIITVITGTVFFVFVVFDEDMFLLVKTMSSASPITIAVIAGAIQNVITKGAKYSIWDTSKEMLYIPLDRELKTKGKAAVDIISAKIGKSSSGLIQSLLFTLFPAASYVSLSPALMLIFIVVCIIWIFSVKQIYSEYKKIV
ncbi:ADP/ATP carrier family protein [Orientia chuto str. Dubai]|uniref:ADP,ATP carrier protein n=1 Tax=Orientia chuto str. Dubai TaxID=1359168 RepID=A0A0F3MKL8_9RICK|nr:Npt1/Npt2 family nucleotide transporter [Candidatus Orientia mediorientalis]KJV56017.1 ADP/ATP carrier family protein [Orientia chuto str. Dubai]